MLEFGSDDCQLSVGYASTPTVETWWTTASWRGHSFGSPKPSTTPCTPYVLGSQLRRLPPPKPLSAHTRRTVTLQPEYQGHRPNPPNQPHVAALAARRGNAAPHTHMLTTAQRTP